MKKRLKRKIIGVIATIAFSIVILVADRLKIVELDGYVSDGYNDTLNEQVNENYNDKNAYRVIRVVDGDTFVIEYNGNKEKVRLIGIDTPESVHPNAEKNTEFGELVSNYSKRNLLEKYVVLEFDVDERDKYGRLLAYAYIDGQMYNKVLLEMGYAKVATFPPNVKYVDEFTQIQKNVRESKRGLWAYEEAGK